MKEKSEIFNPPERTKLDTIKNEQEYLDEKLKDWRKEYESAEAEPPRPATRKHIIFYVLGGVLLLTGFLLSFLVKPGFIGTLIIAVSCLVLIAGILVSPRKPRYKPVNPFNLKLIKPASMEAISERSKDGSSYSFFFDYSEGDDDLKFALTESKYTEEEKQKICNSFVNGDVVVAVSTENDSAAVIIEY